MNRGTMKVLALDTASTSMVVALARVEETTGSHSLIAAREVQAFRMANQVLLKTAGRLMEETGISLDEIDAVVVGKGPGSFTGVRIGVATAKGIACGLGVALYGASTLDAVAWKAWETGVRGLLGVVADAMRKEVYPVRYMLSESGVERLEADSVSKPAEVAEAWAENHEPIVIAGDGLFKYKDVFDAPAFTFAPEDLWLPDGQGLVDAFARSLAKGEAGSGDAAALVPVYTRMSDAEENEQLRLSKMTDPHDAAKAARLRHEMERTDRKMRVSKPNGKNGVAPMSDSRPPYILAIESSCDETAAAVIDADRTILADCIASQIDFHERFGGVVPEIASRKHTEAIVPTVMATMSDAGLEFRDLSAVACTIGPGLVGALVIGVAFAKGLCFATGLPFIGVNHLEGHLYANRHVDPSLEPPFVALLVSGGHTMLVHVKDWGDYEVLGSTLDDAVGEAFDKVAKALELGYPGGPVLSRLAKDGDPKAIDFPRAMMHSGDLSFSLSGLKTAVVTYINDQNEAGMGIDLPDLAASFTAAVVDVLVSKAFTACEDTGVDVLCIGGGVAANPDLRASLLSKMSSHGIRVVMPELADCADNASMIASVALDLHEEGVETGLDADPEAHLPLRSKRAEA